MNRDVGFNQSYHKRKGSVGEFVEVIAEAAGTAACDDLPDLLAALLAIIQFTACDGS
jgi:hypothetical protein